MKQYDLIAIGTGSAMTVVDIMIRRNPDIKVAIIDKDEPGGICLTRGCIPSKILLYPAELVRTMQNAGRFGIDIDIKKIDSLRIMERMRGLVNRDIEMIRRGLSTTRNVDYYHTEAEFIAPYTLKAGNDTIKSKMILLCTGSKPTIPRIEGLERTEYFTSDTLLNMERLPASVAIIGGGYIAAEYGHFLSTMGSRVTIVGRNPQFLPEEEPEVSAVVRKELEKHITIFTNHEVREVRETPTGKRMLVTVNREDGEEKTITSDAILIAAGRSSNSDILHPEKAGIETDEKGWIITDEYLETSQPNIWAFGDANGRFQFKHKANYESQLVYYNAVLKKRAKADYHAVPHAVFTYPEIASVGLKEKEAIAKHGTGKVLIGFHRYQDTAKGEAMGAMDYFVKVIVEKGSMRILGAHIIGPQASVLIQEIINLMYTPEQSIAPLLAAMHIHPSLSEVVERAFGTLMPPEQYRHMIEHHYGLLTK